MNDEIFREAARRRFRRRVVTGSDDEALPAAEHEEVEKLREVIDSMYAKLADRKVAKRVKRIRQGATVKQSRYRNWQQQRFFDEDE